MLLRLCLGTVMVCGISASAMAGEMLVTNQSEFRTAMQAAEPGDEIVLASGEWRDFDMVVRGEGTAQQPIVVRAQHAGSVVLSGQSSLRLGGEYLNVSGLIFRDGYSPRGETISFRIKPGQRANNSRVTETVIDGYSKPDRYESDYWVGLYGKNNRFDHNHLVGKTNKGVTLAVRLDAAESRDNGHRIEFNYFGPRPVLGSNGGETLRIGTSRYSMFNSGTFVENNVFDRTDGEVEIISAKAGENTIRGNLFLKAQGGLTLRHGDNNLVERNVFLGGGKDYTGAIRIINRGQIVRENYMEGLRGTGFASALTIMNGVPNSPVNRYVQVEGAVIERNTVVDSAKVGFGIGADAERSAAPIDSSFANNLLQSAGDGPFVTVDADMSGIRFEDNLLVSGQVEEGVPLSAVAVELARGSDGFLRPVDPSKTGIGAPADLTPVSLEKVGVDWYAKPAERDTFGTGGIVRVEPRPGALFDAASRAEDGDTLVLAPGDYILERTIALDKALTISGDDAVLKFTRPYLLELREGGNIRLQGITIDGELAPDSVGNSAIRTSAFPVQSNLAIELDNVTVRGLTVNKSFNVITLGKSTFAHSISIRDSRFANITGTVVAATAEAEDVGQYNVEYLTIANSEFANIGEAVANVYRGGRDESTFGPFVLIEDSRMVDVGQAATNGRAASVYLHGVQTARIEGNEFSASAPLRIVHTVGTPKSSVIDNDFAASQPPAYEELVFEGPARIEQSGNRPSQGTGS